MTALRRVLFVDDQQEVLEGLRDALRPRRREWRMAFANGGAAALAELDAAQFDVVVSDMRMPGMDGAQLLVEVRRRQPETIRIVLSGYAEAQGIARAAAVAHRFLSKPCDIEQLRRVIERSCALRDLTGDERLRRAAVSTTSLWSVPALYAEVTRLLSGPEAPLTAIAQAVSQDPAIAAKVLQLANSTFFGGTHGIARLDDAVKFIGVNALRALVVSVESVLRVRERDGTGDAVTELQRHANRTALLARSMLSDREQADEAFSSALLQDVGLLLLLETDPDYVGEAIALAQRERVPLPVAERNLRGTTHAELGARLLDLWGLPHGIVEAVAYHHGPSEVHDPIFDVTAAVAIAVALLDDLDPSRAASSPPALEREYLTQMGVADRLDGWRASAIEIDGRTNFR